MKSFQQKRGFKNIVQSRPVLIFLAILLLIFAWSILGLARKMEMTRENRKVAEGNVAALEKEKGKLSSDISKLQTDEGVEESIREKFGLGKEGEGLIIVVEDKNVPKVKKESPKGFFSFLFFWQDWFK